MTLVETRSAAGASDVAHQAVRPGAVLDRRRDPPALAGLLIVVVAAHAVTHRGGLALGMDVVTQFVPWFGWLGGQLRAVNIPEWNPAVLSGMPSAGDPLSGWGYLPAMVLFALLPLAWATHAFLVAQLALVASGTYVLARALRLPVRAALVAAVIATFNGFVFQRNVCCVAFVSVEAWLPWLLLGIDRAVATRGVRRMGAWALAGVALSQVAAGWLGQGTIYVLALAAVWLIARVAMARQDHRVRTLVVNAAGLAVVGAGLAAAAVLPRLEVNPSTGLAGGYSEQSLSAWYGGWWPSDWSTVLDAGIWHLGVLPLVLAAAALVLAWRKGLTWLLAGIVAGALLLAMPRLTPADLLVLWIPGADQIHTHAPQRALLIAYPAVALLAGVAVARLRVPRTAVWVPALVVLALVGGELARANTIAIQARLAGERNPDLLRRVDLATFYGPSAAGRYLQQRAAQGDIGRYAAFRPRVRRDGRPSSTAYFFSWQRRSIQLLEPHNEALLLGLEHTQGYNPTHLARYDDLITAANGRPQDYHVANLTSVGFDSVIFDLLNGRWVIMNEHLDHTDAELVGEQIATWPVVWENEYLRVLENPDALPRAWIVGQARQVEPGQAPELLASGAVDPRRTALLEAPPPSLDRTAGGTATVVERDTDRLIIDVDASGDALLMLSEMFHPAWRATVDGRPAEMMAADHVLRAVPVPRGRHRVEVTLDSAFLDAGLLITGITALGLAGTGARARWWRRR